jgi:hypothetical protein
MDTRRAADFAWQLTRSNESFVGWQPAWEAMRAGTYGAALVCLQCDTRLWSEPAYDDKASPRLDR